MLKVADPCLIGRPNTLAGGVFLGPPRRVGIEDGLLAELKVPGSIPLTHDSHPLLGGEGFKGGVVGGSIAIWVLDLGEEEVMDAGSWCSRVDPSDIQPGELSMGDEGLSGASSSKIKII